MPLSTDVGAWIAKNGGEDVWSLDNDSRIVTCRLCQYEVVLSKMRNIVRHARSTIHLRNWGIFQNNRIQADPLSSDFTSDMTTMLCSIPISWLLWLSILTESMESKSPVILSKIKEEVEGKDIFMALDETTDPLQRSMTAVLIGPLDGHFLGRPYLINLEDVEKADNETMTNVAVSSIRNVFGSEFQRERLKIFITDGAAYCIKAAENLRDHYQE
ncbi:Putative LOC100902024 [Caligus rogercresseyi]|uniref:LOC100902024 n=1 Tax=Caligus rogercresseyi TaxID=217165 RepID=A0A7T8JUZ7_CALRO|nr:Putative LOC100902024 [Caligus rogercresseyi]